MGYGEIGGGCWVNFAVDENAAGDLRQRHSCLEIPTAKKLKADPERRKRVTINFPRAPKQRSATKFEIDLARTETIHFQW